MPDIFISYSSKDIARARELISVLKRRGWDVFWDKTTPIGQEYSSYIESKLNESHCVVVLWTLNAKNSHWVKEEAEYGRDNGILVPARLTPVKPPFGFSSYQAADLSNWKGEPEHEELLKLIDAIEKHLSEPPPENEEDEPKPHVVEPKPVQEPPIPTFEPKTALGLAGRITRSFVQSPLSVLLYLVMLCLGLLGIARIPLQENPPVSIPVVNISVTLPGASVEQVAHDLVEPLELSLSEIPGLQHLYSTSSRAHGIITARFETGEPLSVSLAKVRERVEVASNVLPETATRPIVRAMNIDDVPIMTLTLWSKEKNDVELQKLASDILQLLKRVPDTGPGFVIGGRTEQIKVRIDPKRLADAGIRLDKIAEVLSAASRDMPGTTSIRSTTDLRKLALGRHQGKAVYLNDVASVELEPEESHSEINYYTGPAHEGNDAADGVTAVTITIAKKTGSNTITVANDLFQALDSTRDSLAEEGVHVELTRNYGKTSSDTIRFLTYLLFGTVGLVSLLVWFVLGFRASLIVDLIIPAVVLTAIFIAWLMDITLNRVTLISLIFAIGIVFDDVTVILENIYRRWLEAGSTAIDTTVDAVREVGNPLILSTLTVISALLPLTLIRGVSGPYIEPLPVLGSIAAALSVFATIVFVPFFALRMRPNLAWLEKEERKSMRGRERLMKFFLTVFVPLVSNRVILWVLVPGLAMVLVASWYFHPPLKFKILPADDNPEFSIAVRLPDEVKPADTATLLRRLARRASGIPEIVSVQAYTGTTSLFDFNGILGQDYTRAQPWQGELKFQLLQKTERERTSQQIAESVYLLLRPLAEEANARIRVNKKNAGLPTVDAVVAEVYGPSTSQRRQAATTVLNVFDGLAAVGWMRDVGSSLYMTPQEWQFSIDDDKANQLDIRLGDIRTNVELALVDKRLDHRIHHESGRFPIVLSVPRGSTEELATLGRLPVPSIDRSLVPLGDLGRLVKAGAQPPEHHKDLYPVEYVYGTPTYRTDPNVDLVAMVQHSLETHKTSTDIASDDRTTTASTTTRGISVIWSGEQALVEETFWSVGAVLLVSLVVVYSFLVWEFNSLLIGLMIIAPLPLAVSAITWGHSLMNVEFSLTSVAGLIVLLVITVRNSILVVEFVIYEVAAGAVVKDAIVAASAARTKPIMVSTLAFAGIASVLLQDIVFEGMAITLLVGTTVSILLSLFLIPLGCVGIIRATGSIAYPTGQEKPVSPREAL